MPLGFPAAGLPVLELVLVVALEDRALVVVRVAPEPVLAEVLLVVPVDPRVLVDTHPPVPAAAPSRVRRCPVPVSPGGVLAAVPVVPVAGVLAAVAVVPVVVAHARSSASRAASVVVLLKS